MVRIAKMWQQTISYRCNTENSLLKGWISSQFLINLRLFPYTYAATTPQISLLYERPTWPLLSLDSVWIQLLVDRQPGAVQTWLYSTVSCVLPHTRSSGELDKKTLTRRTLKPIKEFEAFCENIYINTDLCTPNARKAAKESVPPDPPVSGSFLEYIFIRNLVRGILLLNDW